MNLLGVMSTIKQLAATGLTADAIASQLDADGVRGRFNERVGVEFIREVMRESQPKT